MRWVRPGLRTGRADHPSPSFAWLHASQRPDPLSAVVAPDSRCERMWSWCRIGASHHGVRQVRSRRSISFRRLFGNVRDCDSIAVNAPDCGHEYTRRNDVSVPLSTASATSCRAIPASPAATVAGGDQTVGIPTHRGLEAHCLLHRHQHTQVGHRIRRRPCRDPTLRHRLAVSGHDRRGTSPGCAASRAPTPARNPDADHHGSGTPCAPTQSARRCRGPTPPAATPEPCDPHGYTWRRHR